MSHRNITIVHLPEHLRFEATVEAGRLRVAQVVLGGDVKHHHKTPVGARMVTVLGTAVRADTAAVGRNGRRGTVPITDLPEEVKAHIVGSFA